MAQAVLWAGAPGLRVPPQLQRQRTGREVIPALLQQLGAGARSSSPPLVRVWALIPAVVNIQGEARAALKTVLDSWKFGDIESVFEIKHSEYGTLAEPDWAMTKVLLRYEITGARQSNRSVDGFSVILTFQSEAGTELKKNQTYDVEKHGNQWTTYVRSF